jgi:FkbM family methyltransferase
MSVARELALQSRDVWIFGPGILTRFFRRCDTDGCVEIDTRFGRFAIRPSDSDLQVLRQIYIRREYDLDRFVQGKWVRAAYERILQRGRTPLIVDAGANVGYASRFFASRYPRAKILCVEPDRFNAAVCRRNLSHLPNVEVVEAAIGSGRGYVRVERSEGESWKTRTAISESGVALVTMADLKARRGADQTDFLIVKIDIEGFESELFAAATEWVREPAAIIVELHDWMLPGARTSRHVQRVMMEEDRDMLLMGDNLVWIRCAP